MSGVLVIGRSGQVAQAMAECGAARGVAIHAIGRPQLDITRQGSLADALDAVRPDAVVNAAAYTAVDAAESDAQSAFALNARAPGDLATACAQRGVPLVHLSTDYVFDGALDRAYREDDPIGPSTVYGRSKAEGEAQVQGAGGQALIVRTAWVYSPFGKNFVKTMLRLGAERERLTVVADQEGNPTSAHDIAHTVLALLDRRDDWPDAPEILHVAGTGDTTWHGFASEIIRQAGLAATVDPVPTSAYPTAAARPANSRLDCRRLFDRYGLTLPDWHNSLRTTLSRLISQA